MTVGVMSRSWVLNCRQPLYLCELGTGDRYEHVTPFLSAFFIRNSHPADVFLSKLSVIFLRDMMWVFGTAAARTENDIATEMTAICDKAFHLKNGLLVLSCFAQCCTNFLKRGYTVLEDFSDRIEAPQSVRRFFNQLYSFDSTTITDLEEFMLSTLSAEDTLEENYVQRLWKPIFNTTVLSIDKPDKDQRNSL